MDVESEGCYIWGTVAGNAIRMACRITGTREVLIPRTVGPERLATIRSFCDSVSAKNRISIKLVDYDSKTGLMDIEDLKGKMSFDTAAVYFENPTFLGSMESQGEEISEIAHRAGAESVVGVDTGDERMDKSLSGFIRVVCGLSK